MRRLLLVGVLAATWHYVDVHGLPLQPLVSQPEPQQITVVRPRIAHHSRVIMYGMTTCGHCKVKARELHDLGIAYTEYDVDVDSDRNREYYSKLREAGYESGHDGVPSFDVHGVIMTENPPIAEIQKVLQDDAAPAHTPLKPL